MNEDLKEKLDLYISNTVKAKSELKWQSAFNLSLISLLYTSEGREIDSDAVINAQKYIRDNTGIFSLFRGVLSVSFASLLSLSDDIDDKFIDTSNICNMMKERGFISSEYLLFAAYQIAAYAEMTDYLRTVERSRTFYLEMKKMHRFITGSDDYIFSAMFALSGKDVGSSVLQMESLYVRLKSEFQSRNDVQALTQILVLGGADDTVIPRLLSLRDAFRGKKLRIDKASVLPLLGVLALLPGDADSIAEETALIYEQLRAEKYLKWNLPKSHLLNTAAALVSLNDIDEARKGTARITEASIANITLTHQMAVIVASISAGAASGASSV